MSDEQQIFEFLEIFQELNDGGLSPKRRIEVNGVQFGPGVIFQKGVTLGGVDFHLYKYRRISAENLSDGVLRIIGFYS